MEKSKKCVWKGHHFGTGCSQSPLSLGPWDDFASPSSCLLDIWCHCCLSSISYSSRGAQEFPDSRLQAAVGKIPVLPRNAHCNILDGHHTLAQILCIAAAFQGQEKKWGVSSQSPYNFFSTGRRLEPTTTSNSLAWAPYLSYWWEWEWEWGSWVGWLFISVSEPFIYSVNIEFVLKTFRFLQSRKHLLSQLSASYVCYDSHRCILELRSGQRIFLSLFILAGIALTRG